MLPVQGYDYDTLYSDVHIYIIKYMEMRNYIKWFYIINIKEFTWVKGSHSIKGMKIFLAQNKVFQNYREWTKDSACETKMIKTTCPELHAINTETNVLMSHPIKALCLSVL